MPSTDPPAILLPSNPRRTRNQTLRIETFNAENGVEPIASPLPQAGSSSSATPIREASLPTQPHSPRPASAPTRAEVLGKMRDLGPRAASRSSSLSELTPSPSPTTSPTPPPFPSPLDMPDSPISPSPRSSSTQSESEPGSSSEAPSLQHPPALTPTPLSAAQVRELVHVRFFVNSCIIGGEAIQGPTGMRCIGSACNGAVAVRFLVGVEERSSPHASSRPHEPSGPSHAW